MSITIALSSRKPQAAHADANPNAQAAHAYAAAMRREGIGGGIIPCHSVNDAGRCTCGKLDCPDAGKHPITWKGGVPRGASDGSTDAERIAAWWSRWPWASPGIVAGNGLGVVDVDAHDGGVEWWAAAGIPTAGAWAHETPTGGAHVFYRLPDDAPPECRRGRVLSDGGKAGRRAVEWRYGNAYVIAPPARHACGGVYRQTGASLDGPPAILPDALARLLAPSSDAAPPRTMPAHARPKMSDNVRCLPTAGKPRPRPLPAWAAAILADGAAGARRYGVDVPTRADGLPDASHMAALIFGAMAAARWPLESMTAAMAERSNAGAAKVHAIADARGHAAADRWTVREAGKALGMVDARPNDAAAAARRRGQTPPASAFIDEWRAAMHAHDWRGYRIQQAKAAALIDALAALAMRAGRVHGLDVSTRDALMVSGIGSRMTVLKVLRAFQDAGGLRQTTAGNASAAASYSLARLAVPAGAPAELCKNGPHSHTRPGKALNECGPFLPHSVERHLERLPAWLDAWRLPTLAKRRAARLEPLPALTGGVRVTLAKALAWSDATGGQPCRVADLASLAPVQSPDATRAHLRRLAAHGIASCAGRDGRAHLWSVDAAAVDVDAIAAATASAGRLDEQARRIRRERRLWAAAREAARKAAQDAREAARVKRGGAHGQRQPAHAAAAAPAGIHPAPSAREGMNPGRGRVDGIDNRWTPPDDARAAGAGARAGA